MALKNRELRAAQPMEYNRAGIVRVRLRWKALSETLWSSLEGARSRLEPFSTHEPQRKGAAVRGGDA
eukprot:356160-Prymnesium_polylepis.1